MVFDSAANWVGDRVGTGTAWAGALGLILLWATLGPVFGFSDTWQLVVNTGTTIVTFLMVFLVQNAENRNARAMQLKLDSLVAAVEGASNDLIAVEKLSAKDLGEVHEEVEREMTERGGPS